MALTYFYAEWIGLLMLILSVAMLANRSAMTQVIRELLDSRAMLFIVAIISLFIGLLLVLTHNIWNQGLLAILVSLVGWALVLRAALILFLPHGTVRKIFQAFTFEQGYYATFLLVLIVGLYMAWTGFSALGA